MRVLSVSNFYDTHGGGLERVAGHLAREFARAGHDSAWAASDADGLPDTPAAVVPLRCANPIEALTGLPMPLPGPGSLARLARAVRASDAVVIHDALYAPSIAAMLVAKVHRKPTILIQHISGIPFSNPILKLTMQCANRLVTGAMMRAADRLVFISHAVRDDLLGTPPRRASRVLFNGVDRATFHLREREPAPQTRRRWKLAPDVPLAVFVGRFVEKKGLAIVRRLAALRPDVQFALLGQGPIEPRGWGLANVHVLGQQPQDMVADLYRAADVLLLPSVGEGYPLVVQEALACGLPVICGADTARADPAAARWLNGVAVDLADPGGSATRCNVALERLLVAPVDSAAMARYAADTYDWGRMAEAVIDACETASEPQRTDAVARADRR